MQIVEYVQLVVTSLDFDQSDSSLQVEKTQQGAFRIRHYIVKLGLTLSMVHERVGRAKRKTQPYKRML